jgi:hypothetical protein
LSRKPKILRFVVTWIFFGIYVGFFSLIPIQSFTLSLTLGLITLVFWGFLFTIYVGITIELFRIMKNKSYDEIKKQNITRPANRNDNPI